MKKIVPLVFLAMLPGIFVFSQAMERLPQTDALQRIVRDSRGNKINYYEPSDYQTMTRPVSTADAQFQTNEVMAVPVCRPQWFQGVMGACIGVNSMTSKDLDHDGKTEIICSAGYGFGSGAYWYLLRFDPTTEEYNQIWMSSPVNDNYYGNFYTCIRAFDTDNDNIYEIYAGHTDGSVEIFSGNGMQFTGSFVTGGSDIYDMVFEDADNDGQKEIVTCSESKTYLFKLQDLTLKTTLNYGAHAFSVGNVDTDTHNEIVYSSGTIIDVTGSTATVEWDIYTGTEDYPNMGLTDSDDDGMKEVVIAKGWYVIEVYDADIKALKGTIESELDIDALLLADVNNDGKEEILYGDGQWGSIYCFKASGLTKMWEIPNPEHGVTGINVADTDNDGSLEVMWGAGCSSSGSDYIYIHNITDKTLEFQSKDIDGPFYDVETGDVDGDGHNEILTLSYQSESGYESGILSIFDGTTHTLEFQCNGNFFTYAWEGTYAMELADVTGDSRPEIIVATDRLYDGIIYIVDGLSHEILSYHDYGYDGPSSFITLAVSDVDSDGSKELVVTNTGYLYVINPADYTIEWTSPSLSGSMGIKAVKAGNLDEDANPEMVVCYGNIAVFDGVTHSQWIADGSNYKNIDLFDYDGDGILEIMAATGDGKIVMIDVKDQFVTTLAEFGTGTIDGLRVINLDGTGQAEFVFTRDGKIWFANAAGDYVTTDNFGSGAGLYDALKIGDADKNQEKEIYAGTRFQVVQVSQECSMCLGFRVEATGTQASCSPGTDGTAAAAVTAGTGPFTYQWSNGKTQQSITGLAPGKYWVNVTDSKGCIASDSVTIAQSDISIYINGKDVGCSGTQDGSASVSILLGTPPYIYSWSNGGNQAQISGLSPGTYNCTVTDAMGCAETRDIQLRKDTVVINLTTGNPECYGEGGQGFVIVLSGVPPLTYFWGAVQGGNYMTDLQAGTFLLTVTDTLNCKAVEQYTITEPPPMLLATSYVPDDTTTAAPDGQASVSVTGGSPPYYYHWNDPYNQTSATAISLPNGHYTVTVWDYNGCYQSADVIVYPLALENKPGNNGINIYPNPANTHIEVNMGFTYPISGVIKLIDMAGAVKISRTFTDFSKGTFDFDLKDLPPSVYFILLEADGFIQRAKFVISR